MKTLPKSKKPSGKKWWTYYSDARKVNFMNEKYEDVSEIKSLIQKLLRDNKELINEVEKKIIDIKDTFEK
jgi:DNA-binding ferritin-like protein